MDQAVILMGEDAIRVRKAANRMREVAIDMEKIVVLTAGLAIL